MKPTNEQRRKLIELIRNEPAMGWQPTKGGARKGSGKKRLLLPRQTLTIRLSAAARARLAELCQERATTAGKLIDELILKQ